MSLPKGMAEYGRAQSSLAMQMFREGATPDELSEVLAKQARGTHPEGQDPARGLIVAWGNFFGVPLDVVMSNEKMTPEKAAEIVASGIPTSEAKVMQYVAAKTFLALAKNPGAGSKTENTLPQWSAGEGKYSQRNQDSVTNVEHSTGKFDGKSLPNADKGSKSEVAGRTNYPEGMNFNPDLKIHLAKMDGYTQQRGIKGAHNANEFYAAGKEKQIKIVNEKPSGIKGITQIEYLIPTKDRAGNITGLKGDGKNGPFKKTVYDPKVFTDQKMLELGQQAAASGYKEAISKGQRMYDAKSGGIEFRVYLDLDTGRVNNVHPK